MKRIIRNTLPLMAAMLIAAMACTQQQAQQATDHQSAIEQTQPDQQQTVESGMTYDNAQYAYSMALPAGFSPQNNDAEMEASRGGKLFLGNGAMIDVTAQNMDYANITPLESVKQSYEFALAAYEDDTESTIISHKLDGDRYLVKAQDAYGLRADYQLQRSGHKIIIHMTYPADKRAEFDRDVEQVIGSLNVK